MKTYVFDLETDGLLDSVTKIHCATFKELNGETIVCRPHEVKDIPEILKDCDTLIGHNITEFDLPVMKKVLNYEFKGIIKDTLLYSRVLFPDMDYESYEDENGEIKKAKSRHGLENWGIKLGISKPQYDNWGEFTEELLHRNIEDVRITEALYEHVRNHIKSMKEKDNRLSNWVDIFDMEQQFWQIAIKQAKNGWLFDVNLAFDLETELSNTINHIDQQLEGALPLNVTRPYKNTPCRGLKKDGSVGIHALQWVGLENEDRVAGDFCRINYQKTNLNSSEQLKDWLLSLGWEPKEYNFKRDRHNKPVRDGNNKVILTSPKTPKTAEDWDAVEEQLKIPDIRLISERGKASHRLSSLKGWISKLRPDRRLSTEMNPCGTNTARCQHKIVVNVPKANPKVYYGSQFRSLFICPPDRLIVGCDATALEGRCEAHYLYNFDKAAAWELLHGDIHVTNAEVFDVTRDVAKNGKYALLYGCSPSKLSVVLGKSAEESKCLYEKYWGANPGLKHLVSALEKQWEKYSYLVAIDGRPLTIRYEHALLNTLLQSCGSIVVKRATCILNSRIANEGLDAFQIGHFHDEVNFECHKDVASRVSVLAVESFREAGEYYKLNVPIDAESKIGINWKEVH